MAEKALIYNIGMLGDVLTTIPSHRALRRHFGPRCQLTLMQLKVPEGRITPADILLPLGLVDRVISYERGGRFPLKELQALLKLKMEKFDAVCYLAPFPRSARQVERDKTFFRLAGIKSLIGFESIEEEVYNRRIKGLPDPAIKHQVFSRLERLERGGVSSLASDPALPWLSFSPEDLDKAEAWLRGHGCLPGRTAALGIKSAMSSKDWPLERFRSLGERLMKEFGASLVIVGGKGESERADSLLKDWGAGANACGLFSPLQSGALLSHASLFVGVDTGTTHLARAVGTPVVSIFSDRAPQNDWVPFGDEVRVIQKHLACGGCMAIDCPIEGHPCIQGITVDEVMQAAAELWTIPHPSIGQQSRSS